MSSLLTVCSFYRFAALVDPAGRKDALLAEARERSLLGTILLADEGINGTVCGERDAIESLLAWLARWEGFENMTGRWSESAGSPFQKMRVRLRAEIVTLGRPDINPAAATAPHVDAATWNALLARDDVIVIDTRNDYEVEVGTFPGVENPRTGSFREFPDYVAANIDRLKSQPVAMFCTGGIRCEKASALLLESGCQEVYQLDGGVLGYLDAVAADENRWQGECFVFDTRVAVNQELAPGGYVQCHACRRPLGPDDLASPLYEEGLSCPHCHGTIDEEKLNGLRERRRQNRLRRERARSAENRD
ncbi:MAG: rhodanese-related sulfurtransferase [Pseudomonadota bacterium]